MSKAYPCRSLLTPILLAVLIELVASDVHAQRDLLVPQPYNTQRTAKLRELTSDLSVAWMMAVVEAVRRAPSVTPGELSPEIQNFVNVGNEASNQYARAMRAFDTYTQAPNADSWRKLWTDLHAARLQMAEFFRSESWQRQVPIKESRDAITALKLLNDELNRGR